MSSKAVGQVVTDDPICECGHPKSFHKGPDGECTVHRGRHIGNILLKDYCTCKEFKPSVKYEQS